MRRFFKVLFWCSTERNNSIRVKNRIIVNIKMTQCSFLGELTFVNDSVNDYLQTSQNTADLPS